MKSTGMWIAAIILISAPAAHSQEDAPPAAVEAETPPETVTRARANRKADCELLAGVVVGVNAFARHFEIPSNIGSPRDARDRNQVEAAIWLGGVKMRSETIAEFVGLQRGTILPRFADEEIRQATASLLQSLHGSLKEFHSNDPRQWAAGAAQEETGIRRAARAGIETYLRFCPPADGAPSNAPFPILQVP